MNLKHIFKNKNGYMLIEVMLGMFIFSFIIISIFSFIKVESGYYRKHSEKIISHILIRGLEKRLKRDFSTIAEILNYSSEPFKITVKKNNAIIRYSLKKINGLIYITKNEAGNEYVINKDLKIKKFTLNLLDSNGNTVFNYKKTVFFKFKITFIESKNKIFNDFIIIKNKTDS